MQALARPRLLLPILTALALHPRRAAGQSADLAVRRELLEHAQQASVEGRHTEAVDLAERAARIQLSPSLLSFLAQEQLTIGHYALAFDRAEECLREARANPGTNQRETIISACQTTSRTAAAHVAHVVVLVPAPAPAGLHVTVGSAELRDALFGVPYVVDPGEIEVRATDATGRAFQRTVVLGAGQEATVTLDLQSRVSAAPASAAPSAPVDSAPARDVIAARPGGHGVPVGAIVVAAGGVVGVALATVFWLGPRQDDASYLAGQCNGGACAPGAQNRYRQLGTDTTITNVSIGAGVALLAVGATWFIIDLVTRRHDDDHRRVGAAIVPTEGGAMVRIGGAL